MQNVLKYAQENQARSLAELIDFLRIPSISTQPQRAAEVQKAGEWLAKAMKTAGIENVQVIATERHPLVYGDWLHAGPDKPTVLVYGHYDVQPPDPLELWETPPFEPTVRGEYLFARGASDDKGQSYIHVKVAEAYLQSNGRMPVNIRYIFEGEEESGGNSLRQFVEENQAQLSADVVLVSDTHILAPDQPALVYGLRGITYMQMDLTGPDHDLHSGTYGGAINNPLNALCHIVAKLKDEHGRILIPGFYDKVRPLSADERALLNRRELTEETLLGQTGAPQAWGEADYSFVERMGARPTLDVHGIIGGYTGAGGKTVLPSTVHAKISMRLVPDQNAPEIARLFKEYVTKLTPPSMTLNEYDNFPSPKLIEPIYPENE